MRGLLFSLHISVSLLGSATQRAAALTCFLISECHTQVEQLLSSDLFTRPQAVLSVHVAGVETGVISNWRRPALSLHRLHCSFGHQCLCSELKGSVVSDCARGCLLQGNFLRPWVAASPLTRRSSPQDSEQRANCSMQSVLPPQPRMQALHIRRWTTQAFRVVAMPALKRH